MIEIALGIVLAVGILMLLSRFGPQIALIFLLVIVLPVAFVLLTADDKAKQPQNFKPAEPRAEAPMDTAYVDCTIRGIEYMREIGSYPTMKGPPNEGKPALKFIEERCKRTTSAY
jgi:hypothetical protein